MPQIYRITYPNGKIYVGSDVTDDALYFGSPGGRAQICADLTVEQRRLLVLTKEILWEGVATRSELVTMEHQYIRALRSNDPTIGYNRTGRVRTPPG